MIRVFCLIILFKNMDYFKLTRSFWDFAFENPEKIKPNHCALYLFIVEHCNRLGWKKKFGLPTTMAKDAIGIRSYGTYIITLNDLVDFGLIELIEKSKNQYSSNIVAISNFDKAHSKALDKANVKHASKQHESTYQSIDSIDKQYTNIPVNQLTIENNNFVVDCLNSEQWIETVAIQNKYSTIKIRKLLSTFKNHLIEIQEQKKSLKDFKTHFSNWLKKQPHENKMVY